jgi:hypothetical protein
MFSSWLSTAFYWGAHTSQTWPKAVFFLWCEIPWIPNLTLFSEVEVDPKEEAGALALGTYYCPSVSWSGHLLDGAAEKAGQCFLSSIPSTTEFGKVSVSPSMPYTDSSSIVS